jgi:TolB protein
VIRRITTPRIDGEAIAPDFSPNGRLLVYAARPKGSDCCYDLYVEGIGRNASRRRLTRTRGVDELSPTWGPNGRIAFLAHPRSNANRRLELMSSRGGNRRTILSSDDVSLGGSQEMAASISPNGRTIALYALTDAGEGIYLIDADGSDLRLISEFEGVNEGAWDIDFSPNGRTVGWIPSTDPEFGVDPQEVFLVETDGTRKRNLTQGIPGSPNTFTFSPKGERVAVQTGDFKYKLNLFNLERSKLLIKGFPGNDDYNGHLDWALLNPR